MLTHLNTVSSVTIGDRLSRHIQRPASHPAHPGSSSSKATRSHANTGFAEKRHTHATRMFEGGMRELTLMARLGHASPDSTRIYTRISDQEVVADYRRALESEDQ